MSRSLWLRRSAPAVVGSWLGARVLVALGIWLAHALSGHVHLPLGRVHLDQGLVTWDGDSYRAIAEHGYQHVAPDLVRFFPLYPEAGRLLGPVFGGHVDIALVVVANVCALGAMFALWLLVTRLGHGEATADRAVVLAALFPAAMSLVYAYAEAPFLLGLALAALALERRRPLPAVMPLLALGLLRPTGVLVCLPVAILAWQDLRPSFARARALAWAAAAAAPVLGLASYLWWLQATDGRGSAPLDEQREFRAGFRDPVTRLLRAVWDVVRLHFRDGYNLAFAVVLIAAVVVAVHRRLSPAWTAYLGLGVLVALSANNIDSIGRYGLLLAPALPIAAALVAKRRAVFVGLAALSAIGLVWFTTVTALGLVVP